MSSPLNLDLILRASHQILSPVPLCPQLHDLISLLTMVEFWRIRAMSVVSSALVLQEYYTQAPSQTILLLNDQEALLLEEHDQSNPIWREIFIKIIATCISTHLLRLWFALDSDSLPDSHTLFWVYWNEYFKPIENPSLPRDHENQHQFDPIPAQPFHHRLSTSDIDQLLTPLKAFANFLRSSIEPEDHLPYFDSEDAPEPSSTLDDALVILINDYLEYVPALVNDVHNLFPDKFPLPR